MVDDLCAMLDVNILSNDEVREQEAYIANAQFHLDWVRVTINDALTGSNDGELKRSLLQDLDAADRNLRKALS